MTALLTKFGQPDLSEFVCIKTLVVRYAFIHLVLDKIQLDRIEANYLKTRPALVTRHMIALFAFRVDKNFFAAFRTN